MVNMICKRRLHRLRSGRNWFVMVIVGVLFLGVLLTYMTLNGQDARSHLHTYFPTVSRQNFQNGNIHMNLKLSPSDSQVEVDHPFKSDVEVGEVDKPLKFDLEAGEKVSFASKSAWRVRELLSLLYPRTWAMAKEPDEMAIVLKDRMLELNLTSPMSCKDISLHQIQGSVSQSWHKFVEKLDKPRNNYGSWDPYYSQRSSVQTPMVMKSQADDMRTKTACLKQVGNTVFCDLMGNYLLMREIFLLRFLQHPNLIGLLGYCLRGDTVSHVMDKKGLILVLEMGEPFILGVAVTFSWSRKLQLARDVASLLEYLHLSPLGSVGLPRVQPNDFVLVNEKILKLTDMDDADIEEKSCSNDEDCYYETNNIGVACVKGRCEGLNQKTNLRVIGNQILVPLLQSGPPGSRSAVDETVNRIHHLDISPKELIVFLDKLLAKHTVPDVPAAVDGNQESPKSKGSGDAKTKDGKTKAIMKAVLNPQPEDYMRLNSSNYPGQFDYVCPESRVTWGCVMVFDGLQTAMDWCSADFNCKSFVIFSSHPEKDYRITAVFKNDNTGQTRVGQGATLFLKRSKARAEANIVQDRKVLDSDDEDGADRKKGEEQETAKLDPWAKARETHECMERGRQNQEEALKAREKRIMAIMGMKGKLEEDWKRGVRVESVSSFSSLRVAPGDGEHGGSMLIHFNTSSVGHTLTRARFYVEKGPEQNHVAFAMVYALDRLLGLYRVPPTVEGFLRGSVVTRFSSDTSWHSTFGPLVHPDGTLRGLYVAPTPKALISASLTLQPLPKVTAEVKTFNRSQKAQLEYVLLWWLAHMAKSNNAHRGFKGHLVHVNGDEAFQDLGARFDGFFHHCQFPNVVYKMLTCFRCQQDGICLLGQEVVREVSSAGFKLSDLRIPTLSEQDYATEINNAASSVLAIVETCIQRFGRETVLY